jgi:hypothetical protein
MSEQAKTNDDELLAHDHAELGAMLKEVFAALNAGGDFEIAFARLDLFWARLAMHIRAEHLHLFLAILNVLENRADSEANNRALSLETAKNQIENLRADHDFFMHELGAAIKQIRTAHEKPSTERAEILQRIRQQLGEIKRRLNAHNEAEEAEVYKWAETLLGAAQRADLKAQMQRELENLPPRFASDL